MIMQLMTSDKYMLLTSVQRMIFMEKKKVKHTKKSWKGTSEIKKKKIHLAQIHTNCLFPFLFAIHQVNRRKWKTKEKFTIKK